MDRVECELVRDAFVAEILVEFRGVFRLRGLSERAPFNLVQFQLVGSEGSDIVPLFFVGDGVQVHGYWGPEFLLCDPLCVEGLLGYLRGWVAARGVGLV